VPPGTVTHMASVLRLRLETGVADCGSRGDLAAELQGKMREGVVLLLGRSMAARAAAATPAL